VLLAVVGRGHCGSRSTCSNVILVFPARPAYGTAQELRLLVSFGGQTISCGPISAARGYGSFDPWLAAAQITCRRRLRTVETFGTIRALRTVGPVRPVVRSLGTAIAVHPRFAVGPIRTIETFGSLRTIVTIIAILPVGTISTIVAIAETTTIALEGTIAVAIATLVLVTWFMRALRTVLIPAFPAARLGKPGLFAAELTAHDRGIARALEAFVRVRVGTETALGPRRRVIAAITWISAALAHLLLAVGHDDAIIMLGVLEIILRQNRVARRLGISRQRHVFLGNVGRCAAQLHIRAVTFEAPRQRILAFALLIAVLIVIAAAASAVLLSLPHGLQSRLV
jgi:hypothetical protein